MANPATISRDNDQILDTSAIFSKVVHTDFGRKLTTRLREIRAGLAAEMQGSPEQGSIQSELYFFGLLSSRFVSGDQPDDRWVQTFNNLLTKLENAFAQALELEGGHLHETYEDEHKRYHKDITSWIEQVVPSHVELLRSSTQPERLIYLNERLPSIYENLTAFSESYESGSGARREQLDMLMHTIMHHMQRHIAEPSFSVDDSMAVEQLAIHITAHPDFDDSWSSSDDDSSPRASAVMQFFAERMEHNANTSDFFGDRAAEVAQFLQGQEAAAGTAAAHGGLGGADGNGDGDDNHHHNLHPDNHHPINNTTNNEGQGQGQDDGVDQHQASVGEGSADMSIDDSVHGRIMHPGHRSLMRSIRPHTEDHSLYERSMPMDLDSNVIMDYASAPPSEAGSDSSNGPGHSILPSSLRAPADIAKTPAVYAALPQAPVHASGVERTARPPIRRQSVMRHSPASQPSAGPSGTVRSPSPKVASARVPAGPSRYTADGQPRAASPANIQLDTEEARRTSTAGNWSGRTGLRPSSMTSEELEGYSTPASHKASGEGARLTDFKMPQNMALLEEKLGNERAARKAAELAHKQLLAKEQSERENERQMVQKMLAKEQAERENERKALQETLERERTVHKEMLAKEQAEREKELKLHKEMLIKQQKAVDEAENRARVEREKNVELTQKVYEMQVARMAEMQKQIEEMKASSRGLTH